MSINWDEKWVLQGNLQIVILVKKQVVALVRYVIVNAYKSINLHARGRIFSLVGRIVYKNDQEVSMYMYFGFFVPQNHYDLPAPGRPGP